MIDRATLGMVAERHIDVWRGGDLSAASGLYASSFTDHHPSDGQAPGAEGFLAARARLRSALPDLDVTISEMLIDAPIVSIRWRMRGTHSEADFEGAEAQGAPVLVHGGDVIKVGADGLVTDLWHVEEVWKLRLQLAGPNPEAQPQP